MEESFFQKWVLAPAEEMERYIADKGGMPEIALAAKSLLVALQKTEDQILNAAMASRFPRKVSEWFVVNAGEITFAPLVQEFIDQEGEAGHKRGVLLLRCRALRANLMNLIYELVLLRVDLVTSSEEM